MEGETVGMMRITNLDLEKSISESSVTFEKEGRG